MPSHSFRPSVRRSGSGGCRLRATYSNVLAGCVSTEKLEVHRDPVASRGVEIRSITGHVNRQIRRLPPVSHSQAQGGRNHSHALFHYVTPLKAEYIGADHLLFFVFRLQLCGGPYIPVSPVSRELGLSDKLRY